MFKVVSEIRNTKNRKSFLEKINIYIRLIEVFADSLNIKFDNNNYKVNPDTLVRLSELKILNSKLKDDNKLLIKLLKKKYDNNQIIITFVVCGLDIFRS